MPLCLCNGGRPETSSPLQYSPREYIRRVRPPGHSQSGGICRSETPDEYSEQKRGFDLHDTSRVVAPRVSGGTTDEARGPTIRTVDIVLMSRRLSE